MIIYIIIFQITSIILKLMCTWKLHLNKIMQNQLQLLLLLLLSNRIWINTLKQLPKEFSESSLKIFQFIITNLVSAASNKIIFFSTFEWKLSIISSELAYYDDNNPGASIEYFQIRDHKRCIITLKQKLNYIYI